MSKRKALTLDQIEARQEKAVRFLRDVVGNDELADEIESLTLDEYAEKKGFAIENPARQKRGATLPLISAWRQTAMATEEFDDDLNGMTKAQLLEAAQEARDTVRDIWEVLQDSDADEVKERTREDLLEDLDEIASACSELLPEDCPTEEAEEDGEEEDEEAA